MIYKLTLEYDGSGFHGWQAQPGRRTVEGEVRRALEVVTRQRSRLVAAGRTDAGAHALGQVVGVALELAPDLKRLQRSLNGLLPPEIAVVGVEEVAPTFHARFSARRRHYRYLVENRGVRPALLQGRAWHVRPTLDRTAMRAAASALTGRHDLGQFGKDPAGRSTVRSLERLEIRRVRGDADGDLIAFHFTADAFLYGMVRRMVGFLAEVGLGLRDSGEAALAAAGETIRPARVAPACGLYQLRVEYPEVA